MRTTIESYLRADKCYPILQSNKSMTSDLQIVLSKSDAHSFARALQKFTDESSEVTIRVYRKPIDRKNPFSQHRVTVTTQKKSKQKRLST